jgi:imidazolonepropionase-like amidohydrolase
MKYFYLILILSFSYLSPADAENSVLVKGGNVFLPDQGFVKKDLLIEEGKIVSIEDQIDDGVTGKTIYADGKYITPGLVVFSSLGLLEIGALSETNDNSSDIYNAGFDPSKAYNPFSQAVSLNRSKGVTSTVHIPGASGYFSGLLGHTKINNGWKQKKQGPLAVLTSYGQSRGDSRAAELQFMSDLFDFVRNRPEDKANYETDNIQFFFGTQNDYQFTNRDLVAIRKLLSNELPLVVRVNKATDILNVIKFADTEGIELILWEANEAHMVADEIAKAGVPVVLDPLNNIPGSFDSLNATYENVARLNAAGVKMAFYYNQGAGSHNAYLATQSAGNAVAMGVPYNEALNAITKNPADIFGLVDVGQVSVGFEGDIAIWDADPLELTSFVEKVLIDGVEQDLSNRYEELTDRYTKEKDLPNSYRSRE